MSRPLREFRRALWHLRRGGPTAVREHLRRRARTRGEAALAAADRRLLHPDTPGPRTGDAVDDRLASAVADVAAQATTATPADWQRLQSAVARLARQTPLPGWATLPFSLRLLGWVTAHGSRSDVEELLGTWLEEGRVVQWQEGPSGEPLHAQPPVLARLSITIPDELLRCQPSDLALVAGLRSAAPKPGSPGTLVLTGYAYIPGLVRTRYGITVRLADGARLLQQLTPIPGPDESVDEESQDPWMSHRDSGFHVEFTPTRRLRQPRLLLEVTCGGIRRRTLLPLGPVLAADLLAPHRGAAVAGAPTPPPMLRAVRMSGPDLVLTLAGAAVSGSPVVALTSSARTIPAGRVSRRPDGDLEVRFPLATAAGGRAALPTGGYFLECGSRRVHRPIQQAGPLLLQSQWNTVRVTREDDGGAAITLAPPLTVYERTRVGQQSLRSREYGPLRPALFLESSNGRSGSGNPAAVLAAVRELDPQLPCFVSVHDATVEVPPGAQAVVVGSAAWHEALATSRVWVNDNSFPHHVRKQPGQFYLQTWHGTPLKRLLLDLPADRVALGYRRLMAREVLRWDLLLVQSREAEDRLRSALGYRGEVRVMEQPRNVLLLAGRAGRAAARERWGIAERERVVLYAPTWRERHRAATAVAWTDLLDPVALAAASHSVVLVRAHHMTPVRPAAGARVRDVSAHPHPEDALLAADVLVTDYSSIRYDAELLGLPVVHHVPDLAQYAIERGFYGQWPRGESAPVVQTEAECHEAVNRALQHPGGVADPALITGSGAGHGWQEQLPRDLAELAELVLERAGGRG